MRGTHSCEHRSHRKPFNSISDIRSGYTYSVAIVNFAWYNARNLDTGDTMDIHLGHLTITPTSRPVFIFEVGINSNGDMLTARKLVADAYIAGAQVVKFQLHLPDQEMLPGHPLWNILSETILDIRQMAMLKDQAEYLGLVFLCTPFCREAADQLESIGVVGYKLGSGELNNIPLQVHVARKGLPMIISTGMSSLDEVQAAVADVWSINRQIILMNCASTYPATPLQSRLARIGILQGLQGQYIFKGEGATSVRLTDPLMVGQSDHTPTISTCLGAIARGAVVIEKHVTLDKSMKGPDHAASITPDEFGQLVRMGNEVWEGLQASEADLGGILEGELPVRAWANHCLVARRDLEAGHVLAWDDLDTRRPVVAGLQAYRIGEVIGLALRNPLKAGQPYLED